MAKNKGLYKRGNVWWIRYAGPDGKIRFESSRKKEVMEGKDPADTKRVKQHFFKELAEIYLEWAQRQKAFERKFFITKQLLENFENVPLKHFNTRLVEEYQTKVLNDGKVNATANRHLATLKHMFTKAVEWEMVGEETLKKVRRVKLLAENNKRLRYLSQEECQALVDACIPHLKPIVITALNTGMRRGEILSLEWEKHVDLKHGYILLDVTKNGERREIPINQELRETLEKHPKTTDSPYVFVSKRGGRFKDIRESYKSALEKVGIKDFRFHDLRHTFASHLVMAGVDITTVKELLGHKTISMTLRYAHLSPNHKAKAVELLYKNYTI